MAKVKKGNQRITASVSYQDVNTGREYTPFIKRTEQQQIRTGEFIGSKTKIVRASAVVAGNAVTVASNSIAFIKLTLQANDANVVIAWPQINIYIDNTTSPDPDDLWFGGSNVSNADATLSLGFIQLINTTQHSGLNSNQIRVDGMFINRDSSSHTYQVYLRWLYMIVE